MVPQRSQENFVLDIATHVSKYTSTFGKTIDKINIATLGTKVEIPPYPSTYTGDGIVICVGGPTLFSHAMALIDNLKNVVKCTLPIEIVHSGDELTMGMKDKLQSIGKNLIFIDIAAEMDIDPFSMRGFQIKPFAILVSKFRRVMLVDADAGFFTDPSYLFSNEVFNKSGTLYFKDRYLTRDSRDSIVSDWVKLLLDKRSPYFSNPISRNQSDHHQESGVVMFDKERRWKTLLTICKLNEYYPQVYTYVYGDKETFWIGGEIAREPYYFVDTRPGSLGERIINDNIECTCGIMIHKDDKGNPLWYNGGYVKDKSKNRSLINFNSYVFDEDWIGGTCMKGGGALPIYIKQTMSRASKIYANASRSLDVSSPSTN